MSDAVGLVAGETTDLVGREASLRAVVAYLDTVVLTGGALLVIGEAGTGKTALLRAAESRAAGAGLRVIGAAGAAAEVGAGRETLRRLLAPLRSHATSLGRLHRSALASLLEEDAEGAVPPDAGSRPGREVLGSALLALLRAATAAEGPLLLVVDDAQSLDQASAETLAFVARRLAGTRAGVLAATRTSLAGPLEDVGLEQHLLTPLTERQARALLETTFPYLPRSVRERVLREADGNPLALLQLPHVLDTAPAGRSPARERSAADLVQMFGPRVQALPDQTREILLQVALEGSGDLNLVQVAPGDDVLTLVRPAERSGLVRIEDQSGRLGFRHPLVAMTLVELATPAQRRGAHALIAEALTDHPERRAWHLAAATREPDEAVATLLEQQSRACLARGDAAGAERLLQRAAELSTTSPLRARRQVQAAFLGADVTGDLNRAAQLLADADRVEPALTRSLPAAVAATYVLLNGECAVDTAHRLLTEAIDAHPGRDDPGDPVLEEGLHSLLMMSWFGGRHALWDPFRLAVERLRPEPPPLLDLVHRTLGDPVHQGVRALPALTQVLRHVDHERDPLRITRVGLACVYTDRMGECRQALRRVIEDGREGGAVALAINALVSSCVDDWLTGRWDEALDLAAEGVWLCERHGYRRYSVILGGYIDQLVRVCRGDLDGGRAAADEMAEWASDRGAGMTRLFAEHLYTLRAVALGDFDAAYRHVTRISAPGVLAPYNPHALWVLFDLVESATRTDRLAEATAHVRAMEECRVDRLSPRLRMLQEACAALTDTGELAGRRFTRALSVPEGPRWPFDRARIQLAYGEHLHRAKSPAARMVLSEATATFHRLGARPWETRASAVLRASGERVQDRFDGAVGAGALTAREREIARLTARGLTNRQVGEELFLSPRSVGAALYRIFPKLGITSRAALAEALAEQAPRGDPGSPAPASTSR